VPRRRLIHLSERGLWGRPTNLNNVETWANVPHIVLKGADWYRSFGTKDCPGTMLFSLNETEDVNNPGIYELPFGTPLRHLIENCGGGMKDGKKIKAIMPASPSSAYLPADKIDTPLEPNAMRDAGSMLGCGVVHIVREGDSIVDELVRITEFFAAESCSGIDDPTTITSRTTTGAAFQRKLPLTARSMRPPVPKLAIGSPVFA